MSESRSRAWGSRPARRVLTGTTALLLTATLAACNDASGSSEEPAASGGGGSSAEPVVAKPEVTTNVRRGADDVPIDKVLAVTVSNAELTSVALTSEAGEVAGKMSANHYSWKSTGRLEPDTAYVVKTVAKGTDGQQVKRRTRFHTEALTLDEQTYPSVAPLDGETVGIGMPVIVKFDVAVTDRATFQKHMKVTSTPRQRGAWHWISGNEAHWRPKSYWKPGTDVHVDIDVNSVPAGNGIYGQEDREVDFHVGDAHIYRVNMDTHQMKVFSNGDLLRTIPITTGEEPKYTTRSGTKVIIEKFPTKRMNSETIGIPVNSADGYDLDDVKWAMRVTFSGEFIHAAPWSVGDQGSANVSHGCTGMSTENAYWLYHMSRRGDVVEYTGTDKPMTLTNGYGDWNESYADYREGSALS